MVPRRLSLKPTKTRRFSWCACSLHPRFISEAEERKRQTTRQVTGQVAVRVLRFCEQPRKASGINDLLGVKHRQTFRENYLSVFLSKGWLSRTIPEKPKSRLQRYQTTPRGKNWLQVEATGLVTGE